MGSLPKTEPLQANYTSESGEMSATFEPNQRSPMPAIVEASPTTETEESSTIAPGHDEANSGSMSDDIYSKLKPKQAIFVLKPDTATPTPDASSHALEPVEKHHMPVYNEASDVLEHYEPIPASESDITRSSDSESESDDESSASELYRHIYIQVIGLLAVISFLFVLVLFTILRIQSKIPAPTLQQMESQMLQYDETVSDSIVEFESKNVTVDNIELAKDSYQLFPSDETEYETNDYSTYDDDYEERFHRDMINYKKHSEYDDETDKRINREIINFIKYSLRRAHLQTAQERDEANTLVYLKNKKNTQEYYNYMEKARVGRERAEKEGRVYGGCAECQRLKLEQQATPKSKKPSCIRVTLPLSP